MQIAALVISGLAFVAAAFSAYAAMRSSRAARESAKNSAISANAAANAERRAQADADAKRVVFTFERVSRDNCILRNEGTASAYGVELTKFEPGAPTVFSGPMTFEEFEAGDGRTYHVANAWGSHTDSFEISWHYDVDRSDPAQRRRIVMPPRS
ncbi:hypothetical protein [Amycolatopsis magusensis]|uniref:hypothetical protein n=1 Tax=Amycolatopsis magusensis TaxID=882444 RepID=UPI00379CEDA4